MNQVKARIPEIGCGSRSRLRVAKGRARQDGEPGRDRAAPHLRGVLGQQLASGLAGHDLSSSRAASLDNEIQSQSR